MFILSRAEPLENSKDNTYQLSDPELEKQYLDSGYGRTERSYEIRHENKIYTIVCPEYRGTGKNAEPVVIVPEYLVCGRRYPIYVFLFAIDLYSGQPEKGQRWAAEETRKQFKLLSFAHTTLGRALKAFLANICGGVVKPEEIDNKSTSNEDETPPFPTVQTTAGQRRRAAKFLQGVFSGASRQQAIATGCRLAREWYQKHSRFLL
jgi:hypothetical protein